MKKLALALSVVATMSSPAMAEGNAEVGKTKVIVCSACHGVDGNSMIDMYPKLAGQHPAYLEKQLKEFRSAMQTGGKEGRMDPIMGGMSIALSDTDIADISAFFASQTQSANPAVEGTEAGESYTKAATLHVVSPLVSHAMALMVVVRRLQVSQ